MSTVAEKRRDRRVPSDVRMRAYDDVAWEIEAVNLSLGGAYCTSDHRFELMTRLEIHLDLPGRTPLSDTITARAIVVRVEPAADSSSAVRMALLFQEMSDRDRSRLRRFLGQDGD